MHLGCWFVLHIMFALSISAQSACPFSGLCHLAWVCITSLDAACLAKSLTVHYTWQVLAAQMRFFHMPVWHVGAPAFSNWLPTKLLELHCYDCFMIACHNCQCTPQTLTGCCCALSPVSAPLPSLHVTVRVNVAPSVLFIVQRCTSPSQLHSTSSNSWLLLCLDKARAFSVCQKNCKTWLRIPKCNLQKETATPLL